MTAPQSTRDAVVADRASIAEVITSTLSDLDGLREHHTQALDRVTAGQVNVDDAALVYATRIGEALSTRWFTTEGLAEQGHVIPKSAKKLPKDESASATTAVDRSQIGALITGTLAELDVCKQQYTAAAEQLQELHQRAYVAAQAYRNRIDEALETRWCTREGLGEQGHQAPRLSRRPSPSSTGGSDEQHDT